MNLSYILLILCWRVFETDAATTIDTDTETTTSSHQIQLEGSGIFLNSNSQSSRTGNDDVNEHSDEQYLCGDYLHAVPLKLPKENIYDSQEEEKAVYEDNNDVRRLDFILADVVCMERLVTVDDMVLDGETTMDVVGIPLINDSATTITTTTATMAENNDATSTSRRRRRSPRKDKPTSMTVPKTMHIHFYAVASDLELRFRCYPPGLVQPVVGPLPPSLILTSAVYNEFDLPLQYTDNNNNNNDNQNVSINNATTSHPTESHSGNESDNENNDNNILPWLQLEYGLTFVYNSSVPDNTTSATIELWIPTPLLDQAVLLGPAFDHSWSVDLTMDPLTSLRFDDGGEPYWNFTNWNPPNVVWIANGGAGTNFMLNTTFASNVHYIDQTLDGTFQIHQVASRDDSFGDHYYENKNVSTTSTTLSITTLGSNTLGSFVKETTTNVTTAPNDNDEVASSSSSSVVLPSLSSVANIALYGFQQKITIVGVSEKDSQQVVETVGDYILVDGLAIEIFTTADCRDVTSMDVVDEDMEIIFGVDLDLGPNEIALLRTRHVNYCYELNMTLFQQMEQIPGFPSSVNTSEYFATIIQQQEQQEQQGIINTTNSTSENNNTVYNSNNTTNSTLKITMSSMTRTITPFDTSMPLPPYIQSFSCCSTTDLKMIQCDLSGAVVVTKTTIWRWISLITTTTIGLWMTMTL
jgi:hypothetical protein